MKYILVLMLMGGDVPPPQQIGPFGNIFACEQAIVQLKQAYPKRVAAACINLEAKPHHWNGKKIPK